MILPRRAALAAALLATAAQAQTETFPSRPLRMLAPFAPGGPLDLYGRPFAERLAAVLGQPVVFENRPGANGIVATQQVAAARPDGHTLLFTTGSFIGNIVFSPVPLPYDPFRDLAPVTLVADGSGMTLVSRATLPAANMAELVALARARPGALTCGITGIGNQTHIAAEQFRAFAEVDVLLVPLHGTGPAITEMLSGNIDMTFSTIGPAAPYLRQGQLRGYGYTGRRRPAQAPDIPLMREVGFPDWLLTGMSGLWTTGGVAPERIGLLHRAVAAALREPGMQAVLRDSELDGSAMPPEEFAAYLQRELAQQRAIAERIGFNPRGR